MARGGNIPSGYAPIVFGSQGGGIGPGIADKLSQRMMEKYKFDRTQAAQARKAKQERMAKEREELVGALTFEAVEGLGQKAIDTHTQAVEDLQLKYATKLANQGELTTKDYLELSRDKMKVEQNLANYRDNVRKVREAQQFATTNPDKVHPNTLYNIQRYIKRGDVGSGDADRLIQPYFNMFKHLDVMIDVGAVPYDERYSKYEGEGDYITKFRSKAKGLEKRVYEFLRADPVAREQMKDPAQREIIKQQAWQWVKANSSPTSEDVIVPKHMRDQYEEEQIEKGDHSPYVKSRLKKGLKLDKAEGMERAQDLAYRFVHGDEAAFNEIIGPKISDAQVLNNGDIKVTFNKGEVGAGEPVTKVIKRGNFEQEFPKIYEDILPDRYRPVMDKEMFQYFDPKYKTEVGKTREKQSIAATRKVLSKGDDMSSTEKENVTKVLQGILGDKFERYKGLKTGTWKYNGKYYSLRNPEDMKELEKLMDEEIMLKGYRKKYPDKTDAELRKAISKLK